MAEEIKPSNVDAKAKRNIFSMAFDNQRRGKLEMRKKNLTKSIIFIVIALAILIPYSIAFLYPQVEAYLNFSNEFSMKDKQIKDYSVTLADMKKEREVHKAAYDEEFRAEQDIVKQIFPETPDKVGVIRLMEDFATHLNSAYPPFEFSAITFQDPQKEKGYTVLPFQTSIHASQINFDRFLSLINLSGDYNKDNQDHIRLMAISNVTLRYRGLDKTGKDQGVDFDVRLLAYSR
jgi:hypothetical protein